MHGTLRGASREDCLLRQAVKDELEFAKWKKEHSRKREQPEEKQGRVTMHGTFGDWQVDQC